MSAAQLNADASLLKAAGSLKAGLENQVSHLKLMQCCIRVTHGLMTLKCGACCCEMLDFMTFPMYGTQHRGFGSCALVQCFLS